MLEKEEEEKIVVLVILNQNLKGKASSIIK